jgi:hypothetical protein
MSKIIWTVETPAGTVSLEKEVMDEAKFAYFLDWAWERFPQHDVNGDIADRTPANQGKSIKSWAGQEFDNLKAAILRDRKQKAAIAAKDATDGIE